MRSGRPVLGICNGFQILCEAGPAPRRADPQCRPYLRVEPVDCLVEQLDTMFTCGIRPEDAVRIPVAHGEGRFAPTPRRCAARGRGPDRVALPQAAPDHRGRSQRFHGRHCGYLQRGRKRPRHHAASRACQSTRSWARLTGCSSCGPSPAFARWRDSADDPRIPRPHCDPAGGVHFGGLRPDAGAPGHDRRGSDGGMGGADRDAHAGRLHLHELSVLLHARVRHPGREWWRAATAGRGARAPRVRDRPAVLGGGDRQEPAPDLRDAAVLDRAHPARQERRRHRRRPRLAVARERRTSSRSAAASASIRRRTRCAAASATRRSAGRCRSTASTSTAARRTRCCATAAARSRASARSRR